MKKNKKKYLGLFLNRHRIFKISQKGFTLVEMLVIIAIIAILASITVGIVNRGREKAKESKTKSDLDVISQAIQVMALDTNEWPGHQEPEQICECSNNEIEDLSSEASGIKLNDIIDPYDNWNGPYINFQPVDPWGNNYFFDTDYDIDGGAPGREWRAVLGSYGPDGRENGGYDTGYAEDDIIVIMGDS